MGICASFRAPTLERLYAVDERDVLGEGAYSVVLRGVSRSNGAQVAVKRIDKRNHALAGLRVWEEEVAMLRQCGDHPHVISLRDVFDTPEHVFIVTELAEGGELFQTLINEGAYSEWDAKRFTRQILLALEFLHSRNIVHRDIKPENLLLTTKDSRSATIKLADFGMATLVSTSSFLDAKHLSWAYCAPEVLRTASTSAPTNEPNSSVLQQTCLKSDIWSVGIVLFVLLSGIHPFDPDGRQTREQIITNIQEGTFSMDDALWEPISAEAKSFIGKLLSGNPEDRPSAAEALGYEWFGSPHTPRTSLSVSVTNGLGQYQRLMQRKFRTSVLVAMAAQTFRKSLERSRNSKTESSKDGVQPIAPPSVEVEVLAHATSLPEDSPPPPDQVASQPSVVGRLFHRTVHSEVPSPP